MRFRALNIGSGLLGLACAGCVVAPPPPPPAAMMAPPPSAAQQAAPQTAQAPTCREFQQTITIGGTPQAGYGTTCQQPDGSWRVIDAAQPPPSSPPPAPQPQVAAVPAYPYYAYPYPYYYPSYGYVPGYYTGGGLYIRGRFR